jgi:polyhydroxyalkanoate depolymerase
MPRRRCTRSPRASCRSCPARRAVAATYELIHRIGKDYEKPEFGIKTVEAHGHEVPIVEYTALAKPFCRLIRFKRFSDDPKTVEDLKDDPPVLVVAPLSGHHSTLLRDTVRTLLQDHKVYITDWVDARMVPTECRRLPPRRLHRLHPRPSSATSAPSAARDQRLPADRAGDGSGVA